MELFIYSFIQQIFMEYLLTVSSSSNTIGRKTDKIHSQHIFELLTQEDRLQTRQIVKSCSILEYDK